MRILFHGDNIEYSRQEFILYKEKFQNQEIRNIDGRNITDTALIQAIQSESLFGTNLVVCIDNLFSFLGKKAKVAEIYAEILKTTSQDTTVMLWESKELGKDILSKLEDDMRVRLFTFPKVVFSFLDGIQPGNTQKVLHNLLETLQTEPIELIWSMVITRIRMLLQIKEHAAPERISSWQLSRLTNQCRSFTMDKLLDMHTKLQQAESSFKHGTTPFSLKELLIQFIMDI